MWEIDLTRSNKINFFFRGWEWFRRKEIEFRMSWSREMLNGVSLLVNSYFKERIGRGFHIALWPATKDGTTSVILSAENHGKCPDMSPHWRPDRKFTVSKLCSAFDRTSSVWCIISCCNRVKPSGCTEKNGISKLEVQNLKSQTDPLDYQIVFP